MTTAATTENPNPLATFAGDIKLSHSVFAMPFAVLAAFMAAKATMPERSLAGQVALVVLCMVVARSFAMGMNRLLDARLDALNARTAQRAIPSGRLSVRSAILILIGCAVVFELVALGFGVFFHNWWPGLLAMPLLVILGAYPLFKRFTRFCHFYLGFCLGLAPVCAWIAIAATWDLTPWLLAAAVLCWTGGFDILYATQDVDSDRETGTFSLPAKIGIAPALWVARCAHLLCITLLVLLGIHSPALNLIWFIAVGVVAIVFTVEHAIVKPNDLSKLNLAFFTLNGIVSITLGLAGIVDILW